MNNKNIPASIPFPVFVVLWNKLQGQGTPAVHLRIANWLQRAEEEGIRKLLLQAFRSCGKSTLIGLYAAWQVYKNPDTRILVLAADLALARKMVRNTKKIIEKHPLTKNLKPKNADQWGADRFTVKRKLELRDPTMLAKGITANLTGTRADIIICDDVEVPNTCDTAPKREELRLRLQELDFILLQGGRQLYVGTPHTYFTLYAKEAKKECGEDEAFLKNFKRLTIPIIRKNGESAWPERFTLKAIDAMRQKTGSAHFESQMLLRPRNIKTMRLNPEKLVRYKAELDYTESRQKPLLALAGEKLVSAAAWWDPSFGGDDNDQSILALIYTDNSGRHYLHRLHAIKVGKDVQDAATHQCEQVAQILAEHHMPLVGVEVNGIGKFLPGLLRAQLRTRGAGVTVREVTSRKSKAMRILEAFDVALSAGLLYVHADVYKTSLINDMQDWQPEKPNASDDTLDAVAGALSLEPVRFMHAATSTRKQAWMGSHDARKARTEFEVLT